MTDNPLTMQRLLSSTGVHLMLIVACGFLAYCNTFHVPFVFDDSQNIVDNPVIKNWNYFADPASAKGHYYYTLQKTRFVGYLSFALNYRLHGLDVVGYHVVNLVIHIITALLVHWLVLLTFETPFFSATESENIFAKESKLIALFSALLFVIHPIQTQAVTYIVQRFASLATMFYLASLVMYVKSRLMASDDGTGWPISRVGCYALSILFACLAMKTKEIAFTLPFIVVLYELLFFEKGRDNRIVPLIPVLLTLLIIPLSMLHFGGSLTETMGELDSQSRLQTTMPRWDYLFTQFRVIVTYLRLLAFPVNQNLDYDYPVFHSFFSGEVIASFLLLTVLLGVAVWLLNRTGRGCPPARKMWRLAAFGIFWFFITLTVESSVVPIIDVIFEHRLYLPAVGFCVVIPLMVLTYWPVRGAVLLACLVLVLGGATIRRNMVWGDDLRLWLDIAEKSPHKKRVFAGLGDAYKRKGQYDQSIGCYNQYLTFNPDGPSDFINRGTIHLSVGNLESALADFNRAIYLSPKSALAYLGRGRVFAKVNDYISAIKDYQSAIKIDAGLYQAHNNLGNAYDDTGLHDAAINEYGTAIALNPDFKEAYYNRAIAYSRKGMHTEAEKDLKSYKGN